MSDPESTPVAKDLFVVLGEVTAAVASPGDVDETLRLIARRLGEALAVSECRLHEYAGDDDRPPRRRSGKPSPRYVTAGGPTRLWPHFEAEYPAAVN